MSAQLQKHHQFTGLIDVYMKNILESGVLLDEDLEILLGTYKVNNNNPPIKNVKTSLNLTASVISLLFSLTLVKKLQTKLIVIPSILFTITTAALELKGARDEKNRLNLMNDLVNMMKKNHSLDVSIIRYMKTRLEVERKCPSKFHSREIHDFFEVASQDERNYFHFFMNTFGVLATFSDDLTEDFNNIKDFCTLYSEEHDSIDLEKCLDLASKVQDLHIWLSSKLLSYFGVIFCSISQNLNEYSLKKLLNVELPKILNYLQRHYEARKKSFHIFRCSVDKWTDYKSQKRKKPENMISSKLHNTLESVIDNLSIISEKSLNILEMIESNSRDNTVDINMILLDLRNHTFSAYESLDLLCRLYGILSNKNDENFLTKKHIPIEQDETLTRTLPQINHDDWTEPLEENFELYLIDEDIPEVHPKEVPEDQSGAYLNLMLQELKQSLKQHERFIEAKKKRGSQDDDDEIDKRPKSPPRFDLTMLNNRKEICAVEENDGAEERVEAIGVPLPNKPTPLPPPLPMFDLGDLEEESYGRYNSKTMLDNIKALSGQLGRQEEVFSISE
nr:uncharacterized protein LOC111510061 isoform X2 [Leptinotarsa decemlineata]